MRIYFEDKELLYKFVEDFLMENGIKYVINNLACSVSVNIEDPTFFEVAQDFGAKKFEQLNLI